MESMDRNQAFAFLGLPEDASHDDIIARVEADTMEKVKETITWKIRRLDRVRSTLTMIVVEG